MILTLKESDFVNNKFTITFAGNREAMFTIVDEAFPGNNTIGSVNKIVILVRNIDGTDGTLQSAVIGIGNQIIGVRSGNVELRGKVMNKDNMGECEVLLYEEDGTL